jgi:four helix bundle protein
MNNEKFDFESLKVYQKALDYIDFVYTATRSFPKTEVFSLTDQLRRASISICLNIAEGSGGSKAEFNKFLKIARRSTGNVSQLPKSHIDNNLLRVKRKNNHEVSVQSYQK